MTEVTSGPLVSLGSLHLQECFWGKVTQHFERFTRFTWIPIISPGTWGSLIEPGLRASQPPPKGSSANIMNIIWNVLLPFKMQGTSHHWSFEWTHVVLNTEYVSPTYLSILDLKLFLYHSVLLIYSNLSSSCLLHIFSIDSLPLSLPTSLQYFHD